MTRIEGGEPRIFGTQVDKFLLSSDWEMCASFLTKKRFVYTKPDSFVALEFFKHPNAPKREVQPQQYCQLVSYILQRDGRVLLFSETSEAHTVSAELPPASGLRRLPSAPFSNPRHLFAYSVFVNREPLKAKRTRGPSWITFGAPPKPTTAIKEAYSFLTTGERGGGTLLSYSRHGDCPSWYGVGEAASLELQAKWVGPRGRLAPPVRALVLGGGGGEEGKEAGSAGMAAAEGGLGGGDGDFTALPSDLSEFRRAARAATRRGRLPGWLRWGGDGGKAFYK